MFSQCSMDETQNYLREEWFDSRMKFAFYSEVDPLADRLEWFSLDELIELNGREMPLVYSYSSQEEQLHDFSEIYHLRQDLIEIRSRSSHVLESISNLNDRRKHAQIETTRLCDEVELWQDTEGCSTSYGSPDITEKVTMIFPSPNYGVDPLSIIEPCHPRLDITGTDHKYRLDRMCAEYEQCDKSTVTSIVQRIIGTISKCKRCNTTINPKTFFEHLFSSNHMKRFAVKSIQLHWSIGHQLSSHVFTEIL
ncbi:hypothetical protein PMAYCL1PPCAC_08156 [Pristionchus mayeri]|uniref:Uncharacterized protein n=1 Tax=Pristionchus mayeri TaxID=1317129 RepID=A0AAN4ZF39_9BILA|nr:hypothetical protein PMAYCL1PPCAC_08156 [Pristionchus mayeri]